jgi:hypothetical protein
VYIQILKLSIDFFLSSAVILFVVENITYNICDQRFHEFEIRRQNPTVIVVRRTLTQIADTAKLGKNKELIMYVICLILSTDSIFHADQRKYQY